MSWTIPPLCVEFSWMASTWTEGRTEFIGC